MRGHRLGALDAQRTIVPASAGSHRDTHPGVRDDGLGTLMVGLLLLLLLLIVVFGSLGIFVAKVFLFALVVMLLISAITGGYYVRRR